MVNNKVIEIKNKKETMIRLIAMSPETIAEIRNALQVIQLNAEVIPYDSFREVDNKTREIIEQVKRIDGLLPQVKFEEGNKCKQKSP